MMGEFVIYLYGIIFFLSKIKLLQEDKINI